MQKYALKTFDMFFVVSWNGISNLLSNKSNGAKKHTNVTTSEPYSLVCKNNNDKKPFLFKKYFQHFM
jgi:hypothetical protein